jgi:hypothetical protein
MSKPNLSNFFSTDDPLFYNLESGSNSLFQPAVSNNDVTLDNPMEYFGLFDVGRGDYEIPPMSVFEPSSSHQMN